MYVSMLSIAGKMMIAGLFNETKINAQQKSKIYTQTSSQDKVNKSGNIFSRTTHSLSNTYTKYYTHSYKP